jgi:hypothetical protein
LPVFSLHAFGKSASEKHSRALYPPITKTPPRIDPINDTSPLISVKNDTANSRFVILISLVATIGGSLFGFDSCVINGTVDDLSQWVANFGITLLFLLILTGIGLGLGGTYGIYAFISAFFVLNYTKERKGLELEDMQG